MCYLSQAGEMPVVLWYIIVNTGGMSSDLLIEVGKP